MVTLIEAVLALRRQGDHRSLRAVIDLRDFQLTASYRLAQWRNGPAVDRELRRFWRTIVLKAPLLEQPEQDFLFQERQAPGLGGAWLLGGIALSFASSEDWARSVVPLTHRWLAANEELETDLVEVCHVSHSGHAEQHQSWLLEKARKVRDGEDLWQRRVELFPALDFCTGAGNHLRHLRSGELLLAAAAKRLFDLAEYFYDWDSGPFKPDAIPARISPESQPTLEQYAEVRTFLCPDGVERLFSWHARLTPGDWRIYFFPERNTRRGIIGFVGPHLPTARFPT